MTTAQKGDIAWLKVVERSVKKGWLASRPIQESGRYDLILDDGERLYRVQVKYADGHSPNSKGVARCQLTRNNGSGVNKNRKYSSEEVDAVVVYVPRANSICWFPPDVFENKTSLNIRYEPTKNGQSKGCILVQDYEW